LNFTKQFPMGKNKRGRRSGKSVAVNGAAAELSLLTGVKQGSLRPAVQRALARTGAATGAPAADACRLALGQVLANWRAPQGKAAAPDGDSRALMVQHPFAGQLVRPCPRTGAPAKTSEMRDCPPFKSFAGAHILVIESGTPTSFESSVPESEQGPLQPNLVLGSVLVTGTYHVLSPGSTDAEFAQYASQAMLTVGSLREAVRAGYTHAWDVASPTAFAKPYCMHIAGYRSGAVTSVRLNQVTRLQQLLRT
jgi:hypothetical protein